MRWLQRPQWGRGTLVALVALYCVAAGNSAWWIAVAEGRSLSDPQTWLFLASCAIALTALHFVLLLLPSTRWTVRPWLTVVVIATACTVHFMGTYGVLLDGSMLRNILHTDTREAGELLSLTLVRDVALWSVMPLAIIWWPRLSGGPIGRAALRRLGAVVGALVLAAAALAPISRDFISLMRNQRELRYLITPGNFIVGLGRLGMSDARAARRPREIVGADARRIQSGSTSRPRVFVLVVGETARAANFSLNGYSRPTNPELSRLDIVYYSDVRSCGTSTEVSIPCMFSPWGRADYDEGRIRGAEGLLHVLARAGYDVLWLENQSGCKGVCEGAGIRPRKLEASDTPGLCRGEECDDRILVEALQKELESVQRDSVIVLHLMGNHGPAYYRRYPDEFRRFLPDCRAAELRRCSRDEIVNAYDNGIL
jgi:lipid A ethanolaminephosphotransferase